MIGKNVGRIINSGLIRRFTDNDRSIFSRNAEYDVWLNVESHVRQSIEININRVVRRDR